MAQKKGESLVDPTPIDGATGLDYSNVVVPLSNISMRKSGIGGQEFAPLDAVGDADLSKYDIGQDPTTLLDNTEDIRARTQSAFAQGVAGTAKMIGTGASVIAYAESLPWGLASAISTGDFRDIVVNSMTQNIGDMMDAMEREIPNYYSQKEKDADVFSADNLLTANFIFDKFVKNVGFTGGSMLLAKGVQKFGRQFYTQIARADWNKVKSLTDTGMDVVDAVAQAAKTSRVINNTTMVSAAASEAMVESNATYKELLAKTGDENIAKSGAIVNFGLNMAILLPVNNLQFGSYLKGFNETAGDLAKLTRAGMVFDKAAGKYVTKEGIESTATRGVRAAAIPFSEVFQEGGQTWSDKSVTHYYEALHNKEAINTVANILSSAVHGAAETFGTKEGVESMLLGKLTGLSTGIVTGEIKKAYKSKEGDIQSIIDTVNKYSVDGVVGRVNAEGKGQPLIDAAIRNAAFQQQMDKAVAEGDIFRYKNFQYDAFKSFVDARIKAGRFDLVMKDLQEMKNMSEEDFRLRWGLNKDGNEKKISDYVDKLIEKAIEIKKIGDDLNVFTGTFLGESPLNSILRETLFDLSTSAKEYDRREADIAQEISTATNGELNYDAARMSKDPVYQKEFNKQAEQYINDDSKLKSPNLERMITDLNRLSSRRELMISTYNSLIAEIESKQGKKKKGKTTDDDEDSPIIAGIKKQQEALIAYEEKEKANLDKVKEDLKGFTSIDLVFNEETEDGMIRDMDFNDPNDEDTSLVPKEAPFRSQDTRNIKRHGHMVEKDGQLYFVPDESEQYETAAEPIRIDQEFLERMRTREIRIAAKYDDAADQVYRVNRIGQLQERLKFEVDQIQDAQLQTDVQAYIDELNAQKDNTLKSIGVIQEALAKTEPTDEGYKALEETLIAENNTLSDIEMKLIELEYLRDKLDSTPLNELKAQQIAMKAVLAKTEKDVKKIIRINKGIITKLKNKIQRLISLIRLAVTSDKSAEYLDTIAKSTERIHELEKAMAAAKDGLIELRSEMQALDRLIDNIERVRETVFQPTQEVADLRAKYNARFDLLRKAKPADPGFGHVHETGENPEITDLNFFEGGTVLLNSFWQGAKKSTLNTTAGVDVEYERHNIHNLQGNNILTDAKDSDGNAVFNADPDQRRFFDYMRNPYNSPGANNSYSLKLEYELDENGQIKMMEGKEDAFGVKYPVIKAIVYNNGRPVTVNERNKTTGEVTEHVIFTRLHLPSFAINLSIGEKQGENETEAMIKERVQAHMQAFTQFRKQVTDKLDRQEDVFVQVTEKSSGIANTLRDPKDTSKRAFYNVSTSILEQGENLGDMVNKIGISVSAPGGGAVVTINGQSYSVPVKGAVYVLKMTANGQLRPIRLVTRNVDKNEANLIVDILRLMRNEKGANISRIVVREQNTVSLLRILNSLVHYGQNMDPDDPTKSRNNPATQFYIDDSPGNKGIVFGEFHMSLSELHTEEGKVKLADWLMKTKIHHVHKKSLDEITSGTVIPPFIMPSKISFTATGEPYVETGDYDVFGGTQSDNNQYGYLGYLFAPDRSFTKKDKEGKERTVVVGRKGQKVLGTDLAKIAPFVQPYFTFSPIPLDKPTNVAQTTSATGTTPGNGTYTGSTVDPDEQAASGAEKAWWEEEFGDIEDYIDGNAVGDAKFIDPNKLANDSKTTEDIKNEVDDTLNNQPPPPPQPPPSSGPSSTTDDDIDDLLNPKDLVSAKEKGWGRYSTEQLKKEEAWFKERFPGVSYSTVKALIDGYAFGRFHQAAVYIYENAEVGTTYHEAFHVVTNLFLTKEERTTLYDEVRTRDGINYTEAEADEVLAEDFREYAYARDNGITPKQYAGPSAAKTFFEKILAFIRHWWKDVTGQNMLSNIDVLFNNVYNGHFTQKRKALDLPIGSIPSRDMAVERFKKSKVFDEVTKNELFESMTYMFAYFTLNTSNVTPNAITFSAEEKEKTYAKIKSALQKILERQPEYNLIQTALNNWDKLKQEHHDLELNRRFRYSDDAESVMENDLPAIETGKSKDSLALRDAIEFSTKDGLAPIIRIIISAIPQRNPDNTVIYNKFGIPTPLPFEKTWLKLANKLAGTSTVKDIKRRLTEMQEIDTEARELMSRINKFQGDNRIDVDTKLLQSFGNLKLKYLTQILDTKSNNLYYIDSNSDRLRNRIIQSWQNNLRNSIFVHVSGDKIVLNKAKMDTAFFAEDPITFLANLGITISRRVEQTPSLYADVVKHAGYIKGRYLKLKSSHNPILVDLKDSDVNLGGDINALSDIQSIYENELFESQHVNPKGKTVHDITQHSYASIILSHINNAQGVSDLLERLPHLRYLYRSNADDIPSLWFRNIVLELRKKEKNPKYELNFDLVNLEGMRVNSFGEAGESTMDLKDTDMLSIFVNNLLNIEKGVHRPIFSMLRTSDKKLENGYKGTSVSLFSQGLSEFGDLIAVTNGTTIEYNIPNINHPVINVFYKYFEIEHTRTLSKFGKNIKQYKNQKDKFVLFGPMFDLYKKEKNVDVYELINTDDVTVYSAAVKEAIKLYLEKEMQQTAELLSENAILIQSANGSISPNSAIGIGRETRDFFMNKEKGLNLEHIPAVVAIHELAGNIEQTLMFSSDLAFYKDPYKRFSGLAGTGLLTNTDSDMNERIQREVYKKSSEGMRRAVADGSFKMRILEEPVFTSEHIKEFRKFLSDAGYPTDIINSYMSAYEDMKVADGQGYITLDGYKELYIRTGLWTPQHETVFQKLRKGIPLTKADDIAVYFQPIKPMYFGPQIMTDNIFAPAYVKLSLMPLLPSMWANGTNPDLKALNDSLEAAGETYATYPSGIKVGEQEVMKLDYRYMKIQVEIQGRHLKKDVTVGSQLRKLLFSDLFKNGKATKPKYDALYGEYKDTVNRLYAIERKVLLNELGIPDRGSYRISDYEKIVDYIKKEMRSRDFPDNLIDPIDVSDKIRNFATPMDALVNRRRTENLLMAIVNNRITVQKTNGGAYIQASSAMFSNPDNPSTGGAFRKIETLTDAEKKAWGINTSPLKFVRANEDKTALLPAEIYLPYHMASSFNNKSIEDINPELLKIIGYRIPTEGPNAALPLKIAGFLPREAGNLVIVPAEVVAQAGSDFDVDKLNIYLPRFTNDGSLEEHNEQKYSDTMALNNINEIKALRYGLQNKFIRIHFDILTDIDNAHQLVKPNSAEYMIDFEKELNGASDTEQGIDLLTLRKRFNVSREFWRSKNGIAQTALHRVHHALAQQANLALRPDLAIDLRFPHNKTIVDGSECPSLAGTYDASSTPKNRMFISDALRSFITAYVDAAKNPFIVRLNQNTMTADTTYFMIRLGAPWKYVLGFMSNSAIKEYVRKVSIHESMLIEDNTADGARAFKRKKDKIISEIEEGALAMAKIYDPDIESVDDLVGKYGNSEYTEKQVIAGAKIFKYSGTNDNGKVLERAAMNVVLLRDFLRYQKLAKELQEIVIATNGDTKGAGQSMEEAHDAIDRIEKARNSETFLNTNKLFDDTIIGTFKSAYEAVNIFNDEFYTVTEHSSFRKLMNEFKQKYPYADDKTVLKFRDFALTYVIRTMQPITGDGINHNITREIAADALLDIVKDGEIIKPSWPREISIIQKINKQSLDSSAKPIAGNMFAMNYLMPILNLSADQIANMKVYNKHITSSTSNAITESARGLKQISPDLYYKALKFVLIQSGLISGPYSYRELMPHEDYTAMIRGAIDSFNGFLPIHRKSIMLQFALNNRFNHTIVKTVSGRTPGAGTYAMRVPADKYRTANNQPYDVLRYVRHGALETTEFVYRFHSIDPKTFESIYVRTNPMGDSYTVEVYESPNTVLPKNIQITPEEIEKGNKKAKLGSLDKATELPAVTIKQDVNPINDGTKLGMFKPAISNYEHGYDERTKFVMSKSNVGIYIAKSFTNSDYTASEKGASAAEIPFAKSIVSNDFTVSQQVVDNYVKALVLADKNLNPKTTVIGKKTPLILNVGGSNLSLFNPGNEITVPQSVIDTYVSNLLRAIISHPSMRNNHIKIGLITTGGQTGVDEAAMKAARSLKIRSMMWAPAKWKFKPHSSQISAYQQIGGVVDTGGNITGEKEAGLGVFLSRFNMTPQMFDENDEFSKTRCAIALNI